VTAQRTAAAANARHHASQHVRQAAVSLISSVKTLRKQRNNKTEMLPIGSIFCVERNYDTSV